MAGARAIFLRAEIAPRWPAQPGGPWRRNGARLLDQATAQVRSRKFHGQRCPSLTSWQKQVNRFRIRASLAVGRRHFCSSLQGATWWEIREHSSERPPVCLH